MENGKARTNIPDRLPVIEEAYKEFTINNPRHPYKDFTDADMEHLFKSIDRAIDMHRTGRLLSPMALQGFFREFNAGRFNKIYNRFSSGDITEALNVYQAQMRKANEGGQSVQQPGYKTAFDRLTDEQKDQSRRVGTITLWAIQKNISLAMANLGQRSQVKPEITETDKRFLQSQDPKDLDEVLMYIRRAPDGFPLHESVTKYLGI